MRIAIIDDQKTDRESLHALLTPFLHTYEFPSDIQEFSSGESFLAQFTPNSFDICFIDIYMEKLNGMETAKIIFSRDPSCNIIFLTISEDYLAEGYEVRAWRYLIKPLTEKKLAAALTPLFENIQLSSQSLEVKRKGKEYRVPFYKISYVIMSGRNVELHFENNTLSLSSHTTFSQISSQLLTDSRFVLCGKGTLVNLSYVKHIEDNKLIMRGGEEVFISRRKLALIRSMFLEYVLQSM